MAAAGWRGHLAVLGDVLAGRLNPLAAGSAGWRRARELLQGGITVATPMPGGDLLARTTIQIDGDVTTIWSRCVLDPVERPSLAEAIETHHLGTLQAVEEVRRGADLLGLLRALLLLLAPLPPLAAALWHGDIGAVLWAFLHGAIGPVLLACLPTLLIVLLRVGLTPLLRRLLLRSASRLLAAE